MNLSPAKKKKRGEVADQNGGRKEKCSSSFMLCFPSRVILHHQKQGNVGFTIVFGDDIMVEWWHHMNEFSNKLVLNSFDARTMYTPFTQTLSFLDEPRYN